MKLQSALGTLVLLACAAALGGCSRTDQSKSNPPAEGASKPNSEALAQPAPSGKAGLSPACLSCETTAPATCAPYVNCDSLTGNAADGTPKAQLCKQTLDCVHDSGCAADGRPPLKYCYCGTANVADCTSGKANGACKAVLERSLEGNTFADIAKRIGNPEYGGGFAMKRVDCDQVFCRKQCL